MHTIRSTSSHLLPTRDVHPDTDTESDVSLGPYQPPIPASPPALLWSKPPTRNAVAWDSRVVPCVLLGYVYHLSPSDLFTDPSRRFALPKQVTYTLASEWKSSSPVWVCKTLTVYSQVSSRRCTGSTASVSRSISPCIGSCIERNEHICTRTGFRDPNRCEACRCPSRRSVLTVWRHRLDRKHLVRRGLHLRGTTEQRILLSVYAVSHPDCKCQWRGRYDGRRPILGSMWFVKGSLSDARSCIY